MTWLDADLVRNSRRLPTGFEVLWGTPGALRGGIAQSVDTMEARVT